MKILEREREREKEGKRERERALSVLRRVLYTGFPIFPARLVLIISCKKADHPGII